MEYKVKDIVEFEYENPPRKKPNQLVVGSVIRLDNYGANAKGEILASNESKFKAKILVTYGHKRQCKIKQ
jgi:hypothetical protein